jgi:hypothetical protein
MLPLPPPPARLDAAVTREDIEDGAPGRPRLFRVPRPEALQDLAGAPPEPGVFLQDQLDDVVRRLVRARSRGAAVVV